MNPCISLNHVSKQYGKIEVVKDLSFTVHAGQICAFLGPNGAGKSTTMKMIGTLMPPTSGKIQVFGYSMKEQKEEIKGRIGIVFQEDVLDAELTVYENLYYRGSLYYDTKRETLWQLKKVADRLSIEDLLSKPYRNCSGGQKRICQIGRALMSNPQLLLLDEPTIGLDPVARDRVWKVLVQLNQELHMTILFSTHYMEEASYANQLCMINQGKMLLTGTKESVVQQYGKRGIKSVADIYMTVLKEDYCV